MNQAQLQSLFARVADHAAARRADDGARPQCPLETYEEALARLGPAFGDKGQDGEKVLADIIAGAEPGLAAMTGSRFFGWVIGGSHPVGVAADWLASTWGQNTASHIAAPSASAIEKLACDAVRDLLRLPSEASVGITTGATLANFVGLCAARSEVLRRVGWNVEADGLFGAPPVHVVLGEDAHSTVFAALRLAGFGDQRVTRIAVDIEGRMRADAFADEMRKLDGPIIAIAQAGHINTGAFDPFTEIAGVAHERGAWLHVDGAFGLWARAARDRAYLGEGLELADSWAVDGHKWLQTPYDCGFAIVRDAAAHRRAMGIAASYLPPSGENAAYSPSDYVPELSRRARGVSALAMVRHLGREGIDAMVSKHCGLARRFAEKLAAPGVEIMNDVVLNQVAVRLGADLAPEKADALTRDVIARVQAGGKCFVGGAEWRGCWIVRISVIGYSTTGADVDRSASAILETYRAARAAI